MIEIVMAHQPNGGKKRVLCADGAVAAQVWASEEYRRAPKHSVTVAPYGATLEIVLPKGFTDQTVADAVMRRFNAWESANVVDPDGRFVRNVKAPATASV